MLAEDAPNGQRKYGGELQLLPCNGAPAAHGNGNDNCVCDTTSGGHEMSMPMPSRPRSSPACCQSRHELLVRIVDEIAEEDQQEGIAQGLHEQHVGERVQLPPGGREEQGLQHNFHALEDLVEALRAKADPGEVELLVDGQSRRGHHDEEHSGTPALEPVHERKSDRAKIWTSIKTCYD